MSLKTLAEAASYIGGVGSVCSNHPALSFVGYCGRGTDNRRCHSNCGTGKTSILSTKAMQ
jgi:hypothetical protein